MKRFIFTLLIAITSSVWSQDYPGAIPLSDIRPPASDLVYDGRLLLPDQAKELVRNKVVPDLSRLQPREDTDIWTSTPALQSDHLGLNTIYEEFEFVAFDASQTLNRTGMLVSKKDASGISKMYKITLDLKARSSLIRKGLLRKIGYRTPAMNHLRTARVVFQSSFARNQLLKSMDDYYSEDLGQFVLNLANEETFFIDIQDVIVTSANSNIRNLADGEVDPGFVQGRRLVNSLLIPLNLVDVPQNINRFAWTPGRVINNALVLLISEDNAQTFTPSIDDAKWITRRIAQLSEQDWREIVAGASFPPEIELVVTEKIIARRNFLVDSLGLKNEFQALRVNAKISSGRVLVNGKVTQGVFPGYAPRFSGQDPDNPLNGEEIVALLKSKTITNVIANAISEFNLRLLPRTDIGRELVDRQIDVAVDQFIQLITTGKVQEIPLRFYSFPYHNLNLILSREVVAGQYLGSENVIQMADVVGASIDGGWFFSGEGLPIGWQASAQAGVELLRTYTHLKPFNSVRPVLEEPFTNMVIPYLQGKQKDPLRELLKFESQATPEMDFKGDSDEEKALNQNVLREYDRFTELFGVGESFIIQTGLTPRLALQLGYGINEDLSAYIRARNGITTLQRLHIFRKKNNPHIIQIYNDPSFFNTFDIAMGLQAAIPIVEVGFTWITGNIKSNFFEISVNPNWNENPAFFSNIRALLKVIDTSKVKKLSQQQKPWVIQHEFSETATRFNFLSWKSLSTNLRDDITVTHPQGSKQSYVRRSLGTRNGTDLESLGIQVANAIIDDVVDSDVNIDLNTTTSGNPGDTFYGKSVARQVTLETTHKAIHKGQIPDLRDMLINVNYRWKGWSIDRKGAQEIIDQLHKKFNRILFPEFSLAYTNKIQFYSIDMNINFYRRAIDHMLALSNDQVASIFREHRLPRLRSQVGNKIERINKKRKWFNIYVRDGKLDDAYRVLLDAVNIAENTLTFDGLKLLVGGEDNVFVMGSVQGFKVGDEAGDSSITSHSMGLIGSRHPNGPLTRLQQEIGISTGELFGFWLINRY